MGQRITEYIKFFNELFRISKNRIIWGGNYFALPPTQGFIFWYKHNPVITVSAMANMRGLFSATLQSF